MKPIARLLSLLALLPLLAGCAGGWRGGVVPAEWASGATTAMPATAAAPAAGPAMAHATTPAAGGGSHATASGAVFVWKGEGGTVSVAGEFNTWNVTADPLKKQADGSWTLEKALPAGRYAYKFVLDGTNWKADPGAAETVDDGFGGKNSLMVVGGAAGAAAATAAPAAAPVAAPAAGGAGTTATADGAVFRYSGAGGTVAVAGEFNAWNTSADMMTRQADGTWQLVKKLNAGRYAYKFVVDGSNWKEDPGAKETVDDSYGGKNAVVVVGGASAATAPATMSAPATAPAGTAKPLTAGAKPAPPRLTPDGVVFTYAGPAKSSVALCGDFNAWATTTDAMQQGADGTWTLTRKLPAGTYAYKFLVDGASWKTDDGNPDGHDDGFGGKNSIVTVK